MANYFNRQDREKRDLFQSPDHADLSSTQLDLPSKLTLLFKRGFGQKYIANPKKTLDAPVSDKHKQYIKGQFSKATYDHYVRSTTLEVDRRKSFEDYTVMDYTPEISSALDIYADECLTKSEDGKVLSINCENVRIRKVLENLFNDTLDVDHNLWQWTRQMCKYGNHFLLLDVQPEKGVSGFLPIPTEEIRREEAYDGDVNSVKFIWDAQNLIFDSWQIAHFRILSNMAKFPYGTSSLEAARLVWKQLQLAEDAMLIYRITRAPERRVFYIDVGNIDPKDVDQYILDIKNAIKRSPMVQQGTGNMDFKYNPMAVDEDFFIPRRNDKNSQIETLPGASNLDQIGDIEYLQAKMFASLKIPKAYLTFDDKINAKATLSSEDFRFARTINRIQQAVLATLTNIAVVHLYAMGFRDKEHLTGFELELTNPSTQTDLEKMEIWQAKAQTFSAMWNEQTLSPVSYVWGMQNILDFTEDEVKIILQQQFLEGKMKLEIEKQGATDPLTMMGVNPEIEQSQMNMMDAEMQAQGGEMGEDGMGEEGMPPEEGMGGGIKYVDEEGNPLPNQPPEGKAYIDAETGEAIEETIMKLLSTLKSEKVKVENRPLNENSLSHSSTMRQLSRMAEKIDHPDRRNLNENRLDNQ